MAFCGQRDGAARFQDDLGVLTHHWKRTNQDSLDHRARSLFFSVGRFLDFVRWTRTAANGHEAEEAGVEPTEDTYAPSNGFEARAPHRERYSSGMEHAAVSVPAEEALRPPFGLPLQLQFDHR